MQVTPGIALLVMGGIRLTGGMTNFMKHAPLLHITLVHTTIRHAAIMANLLKISASPTPVLFIIKMLISRTKEIWLLSVIVLRLISIVPAPL
jgi:hypothetical protein